MEHYLNLQFLSPFTMLGRDATTWRFLGYLKPTLPILHGFFDIARDLWLDLQDRFTKCNQFRVSDLLQELHSTRQGERSISSFFTDMKILWDELESLRSTLIVLSELLAIVILASLLNLTRTKSMLYAS